MKPPDEPEVSVLALHRGWGQTEESHHIGDRLTAEFRATSSPALAQDDQSDRSRSRCRAVCPSELPAGAAVSPPWSIWRAGYQGLVHGRHAVACNAIHRASWAYPTSGHGRRSPAYRVSGPASAGTVSPVCGVAVPSVSPPRHCLPNITYGRQSLEPPPRNRANSCRSRSFSASASRRASASSTRACLSS